MTFSEENIQYSALYLAQRRHSQKPSKRLSPELRPNTAEEALKVQDRLISIYDDQVGGWKCLIPLEVDKPIAAPIFAASIFAGAKCPMLPDENRFRIEPEIAFITSKALPPKSSEYTREEVLAAVGKAHMALELIQNRNWDAASVTFPENLADCLFNQGMLIGPEIPLEQACDISEITFTLSYEGKQGPTETTIQGVHPNKDPFGPLVWLANHLSNRGHTLQAGAPIITGSFAGVLDVPPNTAIRLNYHPFGDFDFQIVSGGARQHK